MKDKKVKAVEGDVGIVRAVEIWKEIGVVRLGAEKAGSLTEAQISTKTWLGCKSESVYWNNKYRYQRLNQKVIDVFWHQSKVGCNEYPSLMRRDGKIGKMTKSLARIDAMSRTRGAATNIAKAMSINEGKKLGLNIANEFTSNTYKGLLALGEDSKMAASIAIEGMRIATETKLLEGITKQEIFDGVANDLRNMLNENPQITARDELYQEIYGDKDVLSKTNKNCRKKGDNNG